MTMTELRFWKRLGQRRSRRGDALLVEERWDEAAKQYRGAIRLDPSLPWADNNLGAALLKTGHWEEAVDAYWRAILRHPRLAEAHANLGAALLALDRLEEAERAYARAVDLEPASVPSVRRWAEVLLRLRRWSEANLALARAGSLEPRDVPLRWQRIEALLNESRFDDALPVCRELTSLCPTDAAAHRRLGGVLAGLERWGEAAEAFRAAAELDRSALDPVRELAHSLLMAQQFEDALGVLRELARAEPGDGQARSDLVTALFALARWEEVVELLRPVLPGLNGESAEVAERLAIALSNAGRTEEAVAAFERHLALAPSTVSSHVNRGLCLGSLERWEEAAAALQAALDLDPGNAVALFQLGSALAHQQRWSEAEFAFQRLTDMTPGDARAYLGLGGVLASLGRWPDAVAACRQATALDPSLEEAGRLLAEALVRLKASAPEPQGDPQPEPHSSGGAALPDLGDAVVALQSWMDGLITGPSLPVAEPAEPATPDRGSVAASRAARCLFVFDTDYGELTTFMLLALGQGLLERSTLLLPDRLFASNADAVPGRTRLYRSVEDIYEQVEAERADIVFLFSGYLLSIHYLLSLEALGELVVTLERKGCRVVTSDPFLGILPGEDVSQLVSIEIPERSPVELVQARDREEPRLRQQLTGVASILGGLPHVFPALAPGDFTSSTSANGRFLSFFNPALLAPGAAALNQLAGRARWRQLPARPHWLFVLAFADYQAQSISQSLDAFVRQIVRLLKRSVELGRCPILIAPDELVSILRPLLSPVGGVVLLTFCPFRQLVPLALGAEYAFYWNVVSHSILLRLFNERPTFLFDRGHLVRNVPRLYPRVVQWYYQGLDPTYLDPDEVLTLEGLADHAERYRQAAPAMTQGYSRAPSPEGLIATIMG